jgi:hypothetical protein
MKKLQIGKHLLVLHLHSPKKRLLLEVFIDGTKKHIRQTTPLDGF